MHRIETAKIILELCSFTSCVYLSCATSTLALRHTLFMVPTLYDSKGGVQVDFDPRASARLTLNQILHGERSPHPIPSPSAKELFLWNNIIANPHKPLFILAPSTFNPNVASPSFIPPSAKNQGMLCPPNCPTSALSLLNQVDVKFDDNNIFKN